MSGVALAPGGEIIMSGNITGTVDFGTGPLPPPGAFFVAKVAP